MNYEELNWHDAIIKKIIINPEIQGINETIQFEIKWIDGEVNTLIFKDVYYLKFDINFASVGEMSINTVLVLDSKEDADFKSIYTKLNKHPSLDKLNCFIFRTSVTDSEIKIIAREMEILKN